MSASPAHTDDSVDTNLLTTTIRALGVSERRALLDALRRARFDGVSGLSITDLAGATELSRFAASRHLAVLREAGLVTMTQDGYRRVHQIRFDAFLELEEWVMRFSLHAAT
ncbi:transcriptional regulator [Microbacterium sp. HMWF026]|uniref:ArsR/SmtB family transcription factor n=1 Tax=Microbacterium sp. HMWF026 TaxID=2056861 RepID=UPI000D388A04|nr:transcriptional regulator [Microbacterium sp. HMWF026]